MVFSLVFLDPSLPKLASGSPGPPNNFMVKKPTRLGELQLPQSNPFPINRCSRGGFKGEKVQKVRELRENRKKKKKEEKTRLKRYRITIMIIPYIVPCTVFFMQPSVSFVFKI